MPYHTLQRALAAGSGWEVPTFDWTHMHGIAIYDIIILKTVVERGDLDHWSNLIFKPGSTFRWYGTSVAFGRIISCNIDHWHPVRAHSASLLRSFVLGLFEPQFSKGQIVWLTTPYPHDDARNCIVSISDWITNMFEELSYTFRADKTVGAMWLIRLSIKHSRHETIWCYSESLL